MIHTHPKTTCNRLQVLDVVYSEAISIQTLLERLVLVLFIELDTTAEISPVVPEWKKLHTINNILYMCPS